MDKYDATFDPPAPTLLVKIINPQIPEKEIENKALLDSGAYMTVIPDDLVEGLELLPASEVEVEGYKEGKQKHPTYFINIAFKDSLFSYMEVIAVKRKYVLIGRDILNQTKLVLDGKNLIFEVSDP